MVDRISDWKAFSSHMEEYIETHTVDKYGADGFDLMSITGNPLIPVWNILKYSLRIWRNNMKINDIEKIAHYACLAWVLSKGKIIHLEEKDPSIRVISRAVI